MPITQIRGDSQIMDFTIDLGRLMVPFLTNAGGDWDITNGNNDATITGVQDPVNAQDVATKAYVDSLVNGISWKEPVRLRATGNVNLSNELEAGDSIDGVVLVAGDRVLCDQQTTTTEDGVYIVQATGAAVRATDWPTGDGAANWAVFVQEGNLGADDAYVCTNNSGSDVIGTDDLVFVQFAGSGLTNTSVYGEYPTVTNGSPTLAALANIPIVSGTERVYLNGVRQKRGASDDYTINPTTGVITFNFNLKNTPGKLDMVAVDYEY